MSACRLCGGENVNKVIYAGLPGRFCSACAALWGPAEWAARIHFNGALFMYTGLYVVALWHWLTGGIKSGD
jgi:hypothetical protein